MKAVVVGALALVAALYPASARADLVVLQESNGFPGSQDAENAKQKVLIGDDRLKVLDEAHGWGLYVRLDTKKVDEVYASEKGFIEKPLSFYEHIREDREKKRAEHVADYKKELEKAKDDSEKRQLKQTLEKMGLREDGTTKARFETFPDEKKTATLIVEGKKQTVELTHCIVRENEGPPVFDLWIAPKVAQPANIFKFYKEIGTFSAPVIDELTTHLTGFPVEISAVVDDGNNRKTLHSRVHEIRTETVPETEYDLPVGFKVLPEKKGPAQPAAALVPCAICGKMCRPGQDGADTFHNPWTGQDYPVCSDAHRRELIHKLSEEQRQKQQPGGEQRHK